MTTSSSGGQIDFMHWLVRLIAYIIDAIIIGIVAEILAVIVGIAIILSGAFFLFVGFGLFFLAFGILSLLYFIILDVYWGATIGKRLMGLEVQLAKGGRIPLDKSFIRNISKIFVLFLFLDWLIAVVTAGDDRRQKLTDRWAGTTVVQIKQIFQSASSSPPPQPPSSTPST
ncbi:MAG: RDD family protein [Candidatus Bathyarchaeia archaeon]